ncbi:MAG: amidohydrolase family protein [Desulfosporosinus sp.]|nr:amidohydrolase family protein [Desulfosporosinus sp.]
MGMLLPHTALFIHKGRIARIQTDFHTAQVPLGPKVVSLPELTILPAFIDCHVHVALDGVDFAAAVERWSDVDAWLEQVKLTLEHSLDSGLATIRDGGDNGKVGLRTKKLIEKRELDGPRIIACGQGIGKTGKYGSFLGPGISNVVEACQLIDALKEQGVDWLKILVSGIVSFKNYGKIGAVQFTQTELNRITEHAHDLGLPVMAHASSDEAVRLGIKAGVDTMEHGYFVSAKSLADMAEKEIPWVPTVVPVANQLKVHGHLNHSQESLEIIKRTYELQLEKIEEAQSLGVALGIGTDAGAGGVVHGYDYFRELELFAQAGLSPSEVLKAATSTAAQICGLQEELGSIEVGKKALLIGVKGNPFQDLNVLQNIEFLLY